MKKILTLLFFSFAGFMAWAQVGIEVPLQNSSSQLDVVASDGGVLIPRIALIGTTDVVTIANK